MTRAAIGIDFGTTNSSVAFTRPDGSVGLVAFDSLNGLVKSSRSVLYAQQQTTPPRRPVSIWTGPTAIDHYLASDSLDTTVRRRFIQSLKSHLAARSLTGTEIFGKQYRFEDLVARILADLRVNAGAFLNCDVTTAVVGRPITFVGAATEADNDFAADRLERSFLQAGFHSVTFALEPVAAAYAFSADLAADQLLLVGDFGGGTTDFSLLRITSSGDRIVLGSTGVGIAGDAFDARIVRRLIAPALGSESLARSLNKTLPALPAWVYANLERWHTLSFLRTHAVVELLRTTHKRALEPEKIAALTAVVEHDLGFVLHQAVQQLKIDLTLHNQATFVLEAEDVRLHQAVSRAEFESWIQSDLDRMAASLDTLLSQSHVSPAQVDRVFLTGGTSLVPAVHRIFTSRFGAARVISGEAFTSVAHGLALIAGQTH